MNDGLELNNYNHIERLSDEEIANLWQSYLSDRSNKVLRDKLIVQYIYLTRYVIGRVKVNLPPSFSIEDIASYGIEGLIDAIQKYSPNKGAKFETYALMRIRGNIIDKIREQDWVPRSQRRKLKEIKSASEQLRQKLGRMPSSDEIGEAVGLNASKVDLIIAEEQSITSLYDKKGSSDESLEVIDTIQDVKSKNPLEVLENKDAKLELQKALRRLPERERTIMVLYYHENMTLKDIGDLIEISESRVCQLHAQAIMKLRGFLQETKSERLRKSIV